MKTIKSTFIFFSGVIIGCIVVNFGFLNFSNWYFSDASLFMKAMDVQQDVRILKKLRGGSLADGIELLELKLDGDLISLVRDENDKYAESTLESINKAISIAQAYRNSYKRETDNSDIDIAVLNILNQNGKLKKTETKGDIYDKKE